MPLPSLQALSYPIGRLAWLWVVYIVIGRCISYVHMEVVVGAYITCNFDWLSVFIVADNLCDKSILSHALNLLGVPILRFGDRLYIHWIWHITIHYKSVRFILFVGASWMNSCRDVYFWQAYNFFCGIYLIYFVTFICWRLIEIVVNASFNCSVALTLVPKPLSVYVLIVNAPFLSLMCPRSYRWPRVESI